MESQFQTEKQCGKITKNVIFFSNLELIIQFLKFINSSENFVTGHVALLVKFGLVHKWQLPPFLITVGENV